MEYFLVPGTSDWVLGLVDNMIGFEGVASTHHDSELFISCCHGLGAFSL